MCQGKLDPALFDEELENYFYDLSVDNEPSNCSSPCTTLDTRTTLTNQSPSMNGSLVKLVIDKEMTVVVSTFSMDILKLAAEIGGYLGLWLGFSMLDVYSSLELAILRFTKMQMLRGKGHT